MRGVVFTDNSPFVLYSAGWWFMRIEAIDASDVAYLAPTEFGLQNEEK